MPHLIPVNGVHLNVLDTGTGHPLVMLHGLTGNVTDLQPEIDRLARHFRVIAPDARGHGRSDRPAAYTLQDHIADVLGVMDALELLSAHLMGTSMGSYVAQGVATQAPGRVDRLVLVVPKASRSVSGVAGLMQEHADQLQGKTTEEVQAFLARLLLAPETPQSVLAAAQARGVQAAAEGLTLSPEETLAAQKALENFDFRADLPRVTAPTLVISGRFDPINPPAAGAEIAGLIPDARFEVLEHSGHAPGLEEPERLLELVEGFLLAGGSSST